MTTLQAAIRLVGLALVFGMAAVVALGILKGTINPRGLLSEKRGATSRRLSPARVQLLLATLAAATAYVSQAVTTTDRGHLPTLSGEWLAAVGGSNGVYLAGKVVTAFRDRAKTRGG